MKTQFLITSMLLSASVCAQLSAPIGGRQLPVNRPEAAHEIVPALPSQGIPMKSGPLSMPSTPSMPIGAGPTAVMPTTSAKPTVESKSVGAQSPDLTGNIKFDPFGNILASPPTPNPTSGSLSSKATLLIDPLIPVVPLDPDKPEPQQTKISVPIDPMPPPDIPPLQ